MSDRVEMDKHQTKVNDLWFKAPDHDQEIGQRHDFHDFELVQNDYLRNLNMMDIMDKGTDPYKREDYRRIEEEQKIAQMGKLRRKVEFLERGMQRVRTRLQKLQQDPTLTPSMSTVGLRPKQFIDHHDCHVMEQGKGQDTHDND